MSDWSALLDSEVDGLAPQLSELRRRLHQHPEPAGEERHTTDLLETLLGDADISTRRGPGGLGLIADSKSGQGLRVALRGDIDALHLQDAKTCSYRSRREGLMHGCGHDAHATIAVGATLALANLEARGALPWPAPRRLILQHAEETAVGAQEMIDAGALYGVQGIFSLHVDPSRDVGSIGVRSGVLTAACDWLDVRIEGAGGHAARPHESTDPIAAAAQLISAIYALIPRSVDSHEPVVVTIGQISGGYSANVIPDLAHLKGTIRTLDSTTRAATIERLKKLARGIAEASGAEIHLYFGQGPPAVINDPTATQTIRQAAAGVVGIERVAEIPRPSMGGEDFSHYLERVPGAMFRLGVRSPTVGREPLHSPFFDIDERALAIGAKILARAAVLWVNPERNSGARHGDEIQVIS